MRFFLCAALLVLLVLGCNPAEERTDVTYDVRFDPDTRLDLYLPDDGRSGRPAVLFVHGGGWHIGSKEAHTTDAERLARSGWVAGTVGYRLDEEGRFPAGYQDVHCALAYVRAHADELRVDPDRIAVAGMSAGGHLVSLLGVAAGDERIATDCEWGPTGAPAAVISAAGPQDLREIAFADATQEFLGGTLEEVPEAYALASPIDHVHAGAPPFLFLHGSFDVFVGVEDSERMDAALREVGVDSRIAVFPGGGHLLNPGTGGGDLQVNIPLTTPEAWPIIADFLERTMGGPDA